MSVGVVANITYSGTSMEVTRTRSVTSQRGGGGGGGKMESVGATSWSSGTIAAVQESSDCK